MKPYHSLYQKGSLYTKNSSIIYQTHVLYDFNDLWCGLVLSEFGEVVAAECEFQEEGFIGGCLESPPKKRNERDKRSVLSRSDPSAIASTSHALLRKFTPIYFCVVETFR